MKMFLCLLLAILQALPAAAAPPALQFSANIRNEELAEEAIQLLHCLSERSGASWEYAPQAKGKHWLRAEEKAGALRITYFADEKETSRALSEGEAESACEELVPAEAVSLPDLAPAAGAPDFPLQLEPEKPGKPAWPWIAAAGVAAVAGFFIWKGRQPEHQALRMD